jgi:hypothetical protein
LHKSSFAAAFSHHLFVVHMAIAVSWKGLPWLDSKNDMLLVYVRRYDTMRWVGGW